MMMMIRKNNTKYDILKRCFSSESGKGDGSFVDRIRRFLLFKPDGETGFRVYPTQGGQGRQAGYRYPSPGTQSEGARTPTISEETDPFNIQYYTHDTIRMPHDIFVAGSTPEIAALQKNPPPPSGSPGNKNPAVLRYDITGTRSAMSTTWAATEAELLKHLPTHLPTPTWERENFDLAAECERKGIPPLPGKPRKWIEPAERYADKW